MSRQPTCKVCERKIQRERGEMLHLTPRGGEVWLCGRPRCEQLYNDEPLLTRTQQLELPAA